MTAEAKAKNVFSWRYLLFLCLFAAGLPAIVFIDWYRAVMTAFDVAALVFMATLPALFRLDTAGMRQQAAKVDANRMILIFLTVITTFTVMAAVTAELNGADAKNPLNIAFTIITLALAWLFSNLVYAVHYAHLFYDRGPKGRDRGGVTFPGQDDPHYWDFVYFAFTLGMTFQTSDVEINDRQWRKLVTLQSMASFVFNIGIIAFSINILAS